MLLRLLAFLAVLLLVLLAAGMPRSHTGRAAAGALAGWRRKRWRLPLLLASASAASILLQEP